MISFILFFLPSAVGMARVAGGVAGGLRGAASTLGTAARVGAPALRGATVRVAGREAFQHVGLQTQRRMAATLSPAQHPAWYTKFVNDIFLKQFMKRAMEWANVAGDIVGLPFQIESKPGVGSGAFKIRGDKFSEGWVVIYKAYRNRMEKQMNRKFDDDNTLEEQVAARAWLPNSKPKTLKGELEKLASKKMKDIAKRFFSDDVETVEKELATFTPEELMFFASQYAHLAARFDAMEVNWEAQTRAGGYLPGAHKHVEQVFSEVTPEGECEFMNNEFEFVNKDEDGAASDASSTTAGSDMTSGAESDLEFVE